MNEIAALLGRLRREVWIVTADDGTRRGGLTATWVNPASIDPARPTLVTAIAPNHFTAELIERAGAFGAHLLREEQSGWAFDFAIGSGRDRDKLAGLAVRKGTTGAPLLEGALAWFECRVFARHALADRTYYWADVVAAGSGGDEAPLLDAAMMAKATDAQRQALWAGLTADIEALRAAGARP